MENDGPVKGHSHTMMNKKLRSPNQIGETNTMDSFQDGGQQNMNSTQNEFIDGSHMNADINNYPPSSLGMDNYGRMNQNVHPSQMHGYNPYNRENFNPSDQHGGMSAGSDYVNQNTNYQGQFPRQGMPVGMKPGMRAGMGPPGGGPMMPSNYQQRMSGQSISQQSGPTPTLNQLLQTQSTSSTSQRMQPNNYNEFSQQKAMNEMNNPVPYSLPQPWGGNQRAMGYQQSPVGGHGQGYRSQNMSEMNQPRAGFPPPNYQMQQQGQYSSGQFSPNSRYSAIPNRPMNMPNAGYGHPNPQMSSGQPPGLTPSPASGIASPMSSDSPLHRQPSPSPSRRQPTPTSQSSPQAPSGGQQQHSPSGSTSSWSGTNANGNKKGSEEGDMDQSGSDDLTGENSQGLPTSNSPHPSVSSLRPIPSPVGSSSSRSNTPASLPGNQAGSPMPPRPPSQHDSSQRMTQSPMATSYNQQMMPPPMGPNQMNMGPSGGKMAGAVPGTMNPGFSQYNSHFSPGNYSGRPGMPSSGAMHNYPSHHMYNGPMFNNMSVNRNSNYNSQYNAQNNMMGANNPNMSSNMGSVSAPVGPAMDMTTNGPRPFTPNTGQSNSAKSAQAAAHAALMAAANQRGSQPNSRANVNHPSQKVYGQPGQGNHAGFHGSPGMNSHSPVPNSVLPNYNMPKSSSVAEVADSSSHNSHPSSQDGCNSQSNGPPMNSIDASSPSSNIEKMPSQQNIPPSRKQNMQRDSNISSSSNDSVTSSSELTANSANTNLPPQSSFDSKEPQSGTPPNQGLPAESLGADSNLSSLTDSSSQGGDGPSNICEQKEAEIPNMPDQSNLPPNSKQELPITTTATTHTMDVNIVTQSNTCPVMSTTEVVSDSRDHIPPIQQNCLPINPMPPMEEPVPEKKKKKGAGDVHKLFEMGNEPDRHFFLNRLLAFLEERNSPIHNMPSISKQPLDLFRLYHCVRERGGMMEVTKAKKWKEICGLINIGSSASAAFTLKKNYIKYLFHYECQFDRNGMDPGPILANMEAQLAQKRESKKSRAPSPGKTGSQSSQEPFRPPSNSNANQGMEGYPNSMGGQGYDPSMGPMGMPGMVPPNHMMNNMMPPNSMGGGMGHNQMQSGSMGHNQMQGGMVHPGMMGGNAFSMRGGMMNHNMMPPNNMMGNNMMANNMGMGNNMMPANMGMQHGGNMQHSGNMGSSMRMGHGNGPNNMGMHTGSNMHTGNMSMPPNNNMGMMPGNNVNMSQNNMAMPQNNMSSAIPIPPGNQHMGMPGSRNNIIPANTIAGQCVPPHNSDSISCQDPFADDMNNAYSNSSGQPTSQPSNFSGMPSQNNAGSNFNNNSNFNKDRLPPNNMAANPNSLTANVPSGAMGQTPSSISSPPTSMGPNSSSIGPNVNSMGPSVSSMGPTPTSVGQVQPNSSQMGQDQSTPQSRQTASPSNSTTQNMPPNMSQNIPSNTPQGGLPPSSMSQTFSNTVNQCPPQNNMSQQHMQNFPPSMENSHPNLPPDSSVPFSNYQASSNSQDGENSTGSSSSMGLTAPSSGRQFPFGENQFNKPERFDSPNPVQSITPTPTPPPQRQPTPQSSTPSSVASQPPDSTFSSNRYANQSPMMQQGPHIAGAPEQYNQPPNYMPQPGYPTPTKGMMAEQYPNYPSQYNSYPNQRTPMRNDMQMYGTPKQRYPEQFSNQAGYNSQPPSSGYSTQPPGYNSQSPGYNSSGMMGYNSQQSSYGEQGSYPNYQRDSMSTYDSQDTRSNNQWSPMPQRFPQQNPHSMSPAPNMPTHMASGVPYSRNRMSPTPRQQSYMSPPKMKGMIPQNHIPKKDIPFPPDSVEATTPNYYKRRRLTRTDVGPIEAWRVMMALKSGMLAESTWALDTLNILLFDDATVQYFNLAHLPGLLEALLEHFRKSLISIFGEIFEDMEKMSDEADENPNKDFADINMEDRISLEPSEFTNYTHVSRKGLEVKFEDSGKEISPSDSKKWDVFSGYTYKYGHWQLGGGDMSSHILPCFGSENESETFRKLYIRPPMELKDEYKNSAESIGPEKSENDVRVLEQKEDSKLDLNKIKCEVVEDHLKNNILRKVKIKKEPEDLASNNNEGVDLKENCEENEDGGCEIKYETENVKTEIEMKTEMDTEIVIKQEDNVTSNENMCSKRKLDVELEDESYQKDDPPLRMISDAQDDLGKRCVCISNILRSLSSIPSNHLELSKHPGLMYTLGKLLMLNHRHLPRNTTRTKFDRDDAELDILDSHLMQTDQEWWWNYFIVLRENTLVILANICGHLELKYYPEEICLPVLDGLLHWAVCPSSCATDPLSSSSVLSPQRLVLEALSKLCIHETNVDLLLATPPFDRIVQLFSILTKLLANKSEPVTLEFALVLLSSLVQGDSSSARAIAMQHPSISLLLDFLESAEHKAMQVANHHGISALRENPEIMGTSLDMLRRAATILLHLSLVPENRSQFVHQQPRILALVMSQILDQFVAQILSDVLYQCFQSQDSVSS